MLRKWPAAGVRQKEKSDVLQTSDTPGRASRVTEGSCRYAGRQAGYNRLLAAAVRAAAGLLLRPFFGLRVTGAQNLPREGPLVLLPKHQRWEDIPLLGLACPRPLFYVAKQELFTCPICDWFFRSLGGIPLHRSSPLKSRAHLRTLAQLLEQGKGVVIFPEGTYFENGMGPGRTGLIRFVRARLPQVPFVPVGMRYSAVRHRCRVQIAFGRPIRDFKAPTEAFVVRMMTEIAALSGMPAAGRNAKS